jgi:hypothetical protein
MLPAEAVAPEALPGGPTPVEKHEFSAIATLCTMNPHAGGEWCSSLGPFDAASCMRVCRDAAEHGESPPDHPNGTASVLGADSGAAAPAPAHHDDPYDAALRDCVRRMRESGGVGPAICHFERPLDDMDFGQRHCDSRCAALGGRMGPGVAPQTQAP